MKTIKFLALAVLLALGVAPASSAGREIYPDPAQAKADLAAALKTAPSAHKRIILDFGGGKLGGCQPRPGSRLEQGSGASVRARRLDPLPGRAG